MIEGKTKSGFKYEIPKARLENYRLIKALGKVDGDPLILPLVVDLLLGERLAYKLEEHVSDDEGLVSTEKLTNEIMDIFQNQAETKNS